MNFDFYYHDVDWVFESMITCTRVIVSCDEARDAGLIMFEVDIDVSVDELIFEEILAKAFNFFLDRMLHFFVLPLNVKSIICGYFDYSRVYEFNDKSFLASSIVKNVGSKQIYDCFDPYYQWVNAPQ